MSMFIEVKMVQGKKDDPKVLNSSVMYIKASTNTK